MERKSYLRFDHEGPVSEIILGWWEKLLNDKQERAALRRIHNLEEAFLRRSYVRLYHALDPHGYVDKERLALLVGTLAHVTDHEPGLTLPELMRTPKSTSGKPVFSDLRFQRLLKCSTNNEFFPLLVRALNISGKSVDVIDLARCAYWWNDSTRRAWAMTYYEAA